MLTKELDDLPICMYLRCEGQDFTLVIDRTPDDRFVVQWVQEEYTFPIRFPTLQEARYFSEGWLDLIEDGGVAVLDQMITREEKEAYYRRLTSYWPTGKDCMGFVALVVLLATLVLLLYLFG